MGKGFGREVGILVGQGPGQEVGATDYGLEKWTVEAKVSMWLAPICYLPGWSKNRWCVLGFIYLPKEEDFHCDELIQAFNSWGPNESRRGQGVECATKVMSVRTYVRVRIYLRLSDVWIL